MKKYIKSGISYALVLLMCFLSLVSSFAIEGNYTGAVTGWWDQYLYNGIQNAIDYNIDLGLFSIDGSFKGLAKWLAGTGSNLPWGNGSACPSSEDALHHAEGLVDNQPHYDKDGNLYAIARCFYCGADFNVYASDLQQSYDAQVAELPAPSYNSDGSLFVYPSRECLSVAFANYVSRLDVFACPHYFGANHVSAVSTSRSFTPSFDCNNRIIVSTLNSGKSVFAFYSVGAMYDCAFDAPIDGMYFRLASPACEGYYIDANNIKTPFSKNYSEFSKPVYYSSGSEITSSTYGEYASSSVGMLYHTVQFYPPIYKVTPYDSITGDINATYNISSRPTSITGDYGIIGDNGQIVKVEGNTIVNETNNTYYNPATGETSTITDWSYNYEDRSYTLTLEGGAPPGGGTGAGSGSSGRVFSGIFGLLVDFLGFFWNTFRDFVGEGVKGFLTALMDGTSSIFGLLNPFNWGG